ncbi:MAG: hypothetical protein ACOCQD_00235 [archaeon]
MEEIELKSDDYIFDSGTLKYSIVQSIYSKHGIYKLIYLLLFDDRTKNDIRLNQIRTDIEKADEQTETNLGRTRLFEDIRDTIEIFSSYIEYILSDDYDFMIEEFSIRKLPEDYFEKIEGNIRKTVDVGYKLEKFGDAQIERLVSVDMNKLTEEEFEDAIEESEVINFELDYRFDSYHNINNVYNGIASYDNPLLIKNQILDSTDEILQDEVLSNVLNKLGYKDESDDFFETERKKELTVEKYYADELSKEIGKQISIKDYYKDVTDEELNEIKEKAKNNFSTFKKDVEKIFKAYDKNPKLTKDEVIEILDDNVDTVIKYINEPLKVDFKGKIDAWDFANKLIDISAEMGTNCDARLYSLEKPLDKLFLYIKNNSNIEESEIDNLQTIYYEIQAEFDNRC